MHLVTKHNFCKTPIKIYHCTNYCFRCIIKNSLILSDCFFIKSIRYLHFLGGGDIGQVDWKFTKKLTTWNERKLKSHNCSSFTLVQGIYVPDIIYVLCNFSDPGHQLYCARNLEGDLNNWGEFHVGLLCHPNNSYSLLNVIHCRLVPIVIEPGVFVPTKFTRLCLVSNLRPLEHGASSLPPCYLVLH